MCFGGVDLNVKVVVHGTQYEPWQREHYAANDPYKDAKRLGVYKQVQSPIRKHSASILSMLF